MPNRIIKESICTSEKIGSLSDFEFRLWIGLITQADDMGRGDARPAIIKGRVFPLRERVTAKDIDSAIHGLAAKGCVSLYTVGGKPYFWFPTWGEHQRIRDCKAKFPGPEEADTDSENPSCGELRQTAASCGGLRPESNPNPNTNPNPNPNEKETRTPRGKYGWVKLSDKEYERLLTDLGEEELARCIDYVDESAQGTGNKNGWKDWNVTVRRCHRDGWGIRPGGKAPAPNKSTQPSAKNIMKCNAWIDEFLEKNGDLK